MSLEVWELIIVALPSIFLILNWVATKYIKERGHCCLKNGCLGQFKKIIKEVIKEVK